MSCLVARPVVDGIERELEGRVTVYRLNIASAAGRQLASRYGIRLLPTLLVLDGEGRPVLQQVGRISKDVVLSAVSTVDPAPEN